jgi:hypothetical protein
MKIVEDLKRSSLFAAHSERVFIVSVSEKQKCGIFSLKKNPEKSRYLTHMIEQVD